MLYLCKSNENKIRIFVFSVDFCLIIKKILNELQLKRKIVDLQKVSEKCWIMHVLDFWAFLLIDLCLENFYNSFALKRSFLKMLQVEQNVNIVYRA